MQIQLGVEILADNQQLAQQNQQLLAKHGIVMLNLMSSPGTGKTTLLEQTLALLKEELAVAVIEGDPVTSRDAERIARLGVPVVQLNTHGGCHLDAKMVGEALTHFDLAKIDLIIVENVGNLVCPAEFLLGEHHRVTLLSTTEGNDKIAKYPTVFRETDLLVITKLDLLPYTDFELEMVHSDLAKINPKLPVLGVSAKTGEGLEAWLQWLKTLVKK